MKKYSPIQWITIFGLCLVIGMCGSSIAQSVLPNGILGVGPANPAGYCATQTAPSGPNSLPWTYSCTDAGGTYGAVTGQKFTGGAGSPGPIGPVGPAGPQGLQGPAGPMSSSFTCSTVTFSASGASFSGCK